MVTGPGLNEVVEVPDPSVGPKDLLLKMKACGICASDAHYTAVGGIPPRVGATPLGHEPAGEVIEVGAEVTGVQVGDHVVPDPMAAPTGIIGSGGAHGALADYLLIENAEPGVTLKVVPNHIPWEVAALNEPMAVARHAANRTAPKPGSRVVVFGAGPIGLGAAITYRSLGAAHVTVVDIVESRLDTALKVGADSIINSAEEDVITRLIELHGEGSSGLGRRVKPATDIYLDAAGAPVVVETALKAAKHGAVLGVVAVHKRPVSIDFGQILDSELSIVLSMGYPNEIFEVTDDIIANWEKYRLIVSDKIPFGNVVDALALAGMPGAAGKVVVTFD